MKTRLGVIALLLTGLIANTSFAIDDPTGTWRWVHQDPGTGRTIKNSLALTSADGEVGGSYVMDGVTYEVNNAKLGGNTLSWDYDLDIGGQVINIRFSAEISGDTLAGTVNIPGLGDVPWAAQRDVAATVDPTGTWRWEHTDPATGQLVKDVLKITSTKGKIGGSYDMGGETYAANNGRVNGTTLSWDFDLDIEGQALNISFSGNISGDTVEGTVTIAGVGDFPWTAQRDVAAAVDPTGTWRWEHDDPATGQLVKDVLTITSANGKIGGSYDMGGETYAVNNSRVNGTTLSWEFDLEIDGQTLNISFSGDISDDAVAGTVTIAGLGDFPWEAQRDVVAENTDASTSKWIITFTLPDGRLQNPVLVISDDQGTLSAVYTTDGISLDAEDFTVEDGRFSFSLSVPDAGVTARFSGTADGDSATGVIAYEVGGESGELKFIAKKSTD